MRRARTSVTTADVDSDLARRVVEDGDREAFEVLYCRHCDAAYGIAWRVLHDAELAQDVVQEAFLGFWTSRERFNPDRGSLRTWLLTIVHNRSVDAVRRSVSRPVVPLELEDFESPSEDTQDTALRRTEAERVRHALATLPVEQRRALLLAYWGGHTQSEIATLTGVPIGTVKSRIFAGFKRLRDQLHGAGGP